MSGNSTEENASSQKLETNFQSPTLYILIAYRAVPADALAVPSRSSPRARRPRCNMSGTYLTATRALVVGSDSFSDISQRKSQSGIRKRCFSSFYFYIFKLIAFSANFNIPLFPPKQSTRTPMLTAEPIFNTISYASNTRSDQAANDA